MDSHIFIRGWMTGAIKSRWWVARFSTYNAYADAQTGVLLQSMRKYYEGTEPACLFNASGIHRFYYKSSGGVHFEIEHPYPLKHSLRPVYAYCCVADAESRWIAGRVAGRKY